MADYKIKRFKRGWIGKKTKLIVTSPFGVVRKMSWYKKPRRHNGIDIGIPKNTPIYSPVNGTVQVSFEKGGAGLYISIISNGYKFFFMHLFKTAVSSGTSVKEGQLIAYSGGAKGDENSGSSTGPHLHFEVRKSPYNKGTDAINPVYFMSDEMTGKIKQNKINSEIVSISMIDEKKEEESEIYATISSEQISNDAKYDVSDEVDDSATEDETIIVDTEYKENLASGIWQIVKLVMDTDVANIRLRDAATSIQQGSLISFFNKVCQKPFVEFSGDTFGDQYYFLVRKPPFDKEGMLKTLITQGLFENTQDSENEDNWWGKNDVEVKNEQNSPYDIDEDDIISSNISFNNQNIYSWYQFFPIYEMGAQSELQYLIPAVLFPEYAAIWGSRDLQVRSQYRNFINPNLYDDVKNGEKNIQGDTEVRHSIQDLHYIIESNAYNPFVRSGNIQILGNRRIKRGTFIRVKWNSLSCREIFYVDGVNHSYSVSGGSVSRTTSISLSHGMLEDYMFNKENNVFGINDNGERVSKNFNASYFNIIDFGDYENIKDKIDMDKWSEVVSSWKVNIDVFLFFLRKLQFLSNNLSCYPIITEQNKTKKK